MSVTVIGLDSFISGLGAAKDVTKAVVTKAALAMALEVRRVAQSKVKKGTSVLAQSITAMPLEYGATTTVGEKYGTYLEYGTGMFDPRGAHLIYPTTSTVLAWSSGGGEYFAKWTRGMEAQPFFWPAVDESQPFVIEEMHRAADILVKTAVGVA
jgi:HK97 gp10 family phage protein